MKLGEVSVEEILEKLFEVNSNVLLHLLRGTIHMSSSAIMNWERALETGGDMPEKFKGCLRDKGIFSLLTEAIHNLNQLTEILEEKEVKSDQ